MSLMKLFFSGEIKKAETRTVGGKQLIELSLCKRFKGRNGAEDTFTWIRVSLWEPAAFQVSLLVRGAFISGSGEFQLRSYEAKDGQKAVSADIRCSSFDIDIHDVSPHESAPRPAPKANVTMTQATRDSIGGVDSESPPF